MQNVELVQVPMPEIIADYRLGKADTPGENPGKGGPEVVSVKIPEGVLGVTCLPYRVLDADALSVAIDGKPGAVDILNLTALDLQGKEAPILFKDNEVTLAP